MEYNVSFLFKLKQKVNQGSQRPPGDRRKVKVPTSVLHPFVELIF